MGTLLGSKVRWAAQGSAPWSRAAPAGSSCSPAERTASLPDYGNNATVMPYTHLKQSREAPHVRQPSGIWQVCFRSVLAGWIQPVPVQKEPTCISALNRASAGSRPCNETNPAAYIPTLLLSQYSVQNEATRHQLNIFSPLLSPRFLHEM